MTSNAIFKSFCKLHDEIKQYAEKLNVDKGNVVSLSVLLYYIHRKHPTLAAFVWASSFTTFARKTLCLYSTKQMFFGFVALQ